MLPEHNILIDCLNNRFENIALVNLTSENWSTVVAEASRHRIVPLLYQKIRQARAEDLIPNEIVSHLRGKYLAKAYRNTVLFHQLDELVAALDTANIPVLLLKGAHLAEFVYKDIALRPMSDLDILVKEEHLHETVQVAFKAGYQFFFDNDPEKEKHIENYDYGVMPDFKHFHALIHPETKSMLEIHCFISSENSPFKILSSELWQNTQSETLNKKTVFVLSPEDLVIHLCLHAAYDHLFDFGLGALYDIAITIKYYEKNIDWNEIQHRSMKWRTNQCLFLSLYFSKKWLGVSIPDEILINFHIGKMVHTAEERIFKTEETVPLHQHYIQWRSHRSLHDKLRYVLNVLFPSRKFMKNRYLKPLDSRMLLSSYLLRFFHILKGIRGIVKSAIHDGQYISRLKQGDKDLRLRKWLIKS